MNESSSYLRRAVVLLFAALAFLPVADWLPGGVALVDFAGQLRSWMIGLFLPLFLGTAMALGRVHDRIGPWLAQREPSARAASGLLGLLLLASLGLFGWAALAVFDGVPLHVDSMTQAVQARVFAAGRLFMETPDHPEFTSSLLMVEHGGRSYAQFPPGWAGVLAVGYLVGVPWLAGPLMGTVAVGASFALARALGESRLTALAVALLVAVSPWVMFNAGSWMNHTMALALLTAAAAAVVRVQRDDEEAAIRWAVGAGLLLGAAAWVRPLEAAAFALPALLWVGVRVGPHRIGRLAGLSIGLLVPGGALLVWNTWMNGAPLTFAYEIQWGALHGLGFHEAPFGPAHTPLRGLELVNKYLLQMQTVLFEAGAPALLPAALALLLTRAVAPGDRYLLASGALLLLGYFAYWHEGDYLGPRFLLPLAPIAILWTVRLPTVLEKWSRSEAIGFAAGVAVATAVAAGSIVGMPGRKDVYERIMPARRFDAEAIRTDASLANTVLLVPATWGTQVQARMWARGLPRRDAEWLRARADLCRLDYEVQQLERAEADNPLSTAHVLLPLAADSLRVVPSTLSPDTTQRMLRGASYPPPCQVRLQEERPGMSVLPFLPRDPEGPRIVRDLHERNRLIIDLQDPPPVYRLGLDADGTVRKHVVDLDSAYYQWRGWLQAAGS